MLLTEKIFILLEDYHRQGKLFSQVSAFDQDLIINIGFYPNGQYCFRLTVKDGRLHGPGRLYYDNGQIEREEPFHKGLLHGVSRSWYRSGVIKSEVGLTNNHYNGMRREWFSSGAMKFECMYKMDQLEGHLTRWHSNGQIKERGSYLEGKRHGIFKEFDEQGKSITKKLFVRGVEYIGKLDRLISSTRLCAKRILRIKSAPVRRILLEELGYAHFVRELPVLVLDREGDQELLKVDWHKEEEPLYLVKVRCPSTSTYYTLRVPPHVKTVKEAVAWTFGLNGKDYSPREET